MVRQTLFRLPREDREALYKKKQLSIADIPLKASFTLSELSSITGITRHSLERAVIKKRLKAQKVPGKRLLKIRLADLDEYLFNKGPDNKTYKGKPLFDHRKGLYSIRQVSVKLGISKDKIRKFSEKGIIKATKVAGRWVFHINDIREYQAQSTSPDQSSSDSQKE